MVAVAEDAAADIVDTAGHRTNPGQLRLLVVDDHAAVRRGLSELLDDHDDFRVVAAVPTAELSMSVAERETPEVAIVDYQLRGRSGLWVSRKLKRLPCPPRVVIYSAYSDGLLAAAAVVAEADGVLGKGGLGSDLCDAVRGVACGQSLFPMVRWQVAEMLRRRLDGEEQAIFGMSRAGIAAAEIAKTLRISESDSRQIADALVIGEKTVERHRANILEKLGMHDRVELTRYAIRRGLVEP